MTPFGICVNAILLGPVGTGFLNQTISEEKTLFLIEFLWDALQLEKSLAV